MSPLPLGRNLSAILSCGMIVSLMSLVDPLVVLFICSGGGRGALPVGSWMAFLQLLGDHKLQAVNHLKWRSRWIEQIGAGYCFMSLGLRKQVTCSIQNQLYKW